MTGSGSRQISFSFNPSCFIFSGERKPEFPMQSFHVPSFLPFFNMFRHVPVQSLYDDSEWLFLRLIMHIYPVSWIREQKAAWATHHCNRNSWTCLLIFFKISRFCINCPFRLKNSCFGMPECSSVLRLLMQNKQMISMKLIRKNIFRYKFTIRI